jgi:hypothetical protein
MSGGAPVRHRTGGPCVLRCRFQEKLHGSAANSLPALCQHVADLSAIALAAFAADREADVPLKCCQNIAAALLTLGHDELALGCVDSLAS